MIVNMRDMLLKARQERYAIPHFNINNLEWTRYILEECNVNNSPVIIGVSESTISYMGGYNTVSNIIYNLFSELNIHIPVVIHLDHGSTFESCKKAIDAHFTSVMFDGSKLSLKENINITNEVIKYAHLRDVSVEAEVGQIGGIEDNNITNLQYANIDDSISFVRSTNVDCLAPSIGNCHGLYKGKAKLNYNILLGIRKQLDIPLVLHGGTGIDDSDLKEAINCGICKININTELQIAWSNSVRNFLIENPNEYDPRKIIKSGEAAIKKVVKDKLIVLGSINRA